METKPWYLSKGMWAGIIGLAIVIWNAVPVYLPSVHLPAIPEFVLGLLATFGLYARKTATTTIA
jgi:hypothetical protein